MKKWIGRSHKYQNPEESYGAWFDIKEERYYGGTENKLNLEFTAIIGFSDLFIYEENKVNVADRITIKGTKDSIYFVGSVIQLYEGYGYKWVEE